MKNQPTISVIKTAIRVEVVSPKSFQAQPIKNSAKVLVMIMAEKAQTKTLNHLRGILTKDT
ncbi:hypothetical protein F4X10_17765 [Candidatus Poribacteria bacterium]|nr:hypothetical protein [Candidatus Poribacteria bacterium]